MIAVSMLVGEYFYFAALRSPAALVSVVISLRRSGTLVSYAGGIGLFHERPGGQKSLAVVGMLAGIVLTIVG